ncbi:MAG: polysaccharide pyruvyl transferase family protein [Leucobacter sp.]
MTTHHLFVAVHGQDDNVGDPALRRAMIQDLGRDLQRHVLVGAASPAYLKALALRDDDLIYTKRKDWQKAALRKASLGRASYASNSGEMQLHARRHRINRADLALIRLIRLRGRGATLFTGVGIRNPEDKPSPTLRAIASLSDMAVWRDQPSRDFCGAGEVGPDWAFGLYNDDQACETERDSIVLSMRGDNSIPSDKWMRVVRTLATQSSCQLLTATQVGRDHLRNQEIAKELNAKDTPWLGDDHLYEEARLRSIYRRSRIVISDRLHVLILAAIEGATPIYLPTDPSCKIPRTLAPVGLDQFATDPAIQDSETAVESILSLAGKQATLMRNIKDAFRQVNLRKSQMNATLSR